MAEFGRVCGGQADLFRAILARISHLNKLPVRKPLGTWFQQAYYCVSRTKGGTTECLTVGSLLEDLQNTLPTYSHHLQAVGFLPLRLALFSAILVYLCPGCFI
jgi:hypothetical protein